MPNPRIKRTYGTLERSASPSPIFLLPRWHTARKSATTLCRLGSSVATRCAPLQARAVLPIMNKPGVAGYTSGSSRRPVGVWPAYLKAGITSVAKRRICLTRDA